MNPSWQIKMLYDGKCPLCSREVAMLRKRNSRGLIDFEDIADPGFDPTKYGLTIDQVIGAMHAVRPDGSIVRGVDVFAEVYDAVGWTWLARLIRWPVTRPIAKLGYRLFAAIRPKLSRFRPECADSCRRTTPQRIGVGLLLSALASSMTACAPSPEPMPAERDGSHPIQQATTQESAEMKKPFLVGEAELPVGFPPPGPVNEVIVKYYPACRAAVVQASAVAVGNEGGMFRSLFNHIQSNNIAMTAPVDMTWADATTQPADEKPLAMAFVYGDPSIGKPGTDGIVKVIDLPSANFVSVGIRGSYDRDHFEKGLKQLKDSLAIDHKSYIISGPPRYLAYNSPFVPWFMKYGEVQLPVTGPRLMHPIDP